MYYDFAVEIPSVKGKIIAKRKGSTTYILYQYGQDYHKDKRYCIPKRAIIGKMIPEQAGKMFPNEKYSVYFPDAALPEELPETYRSCSLRIGSYTVIRKVMEDYGLPAMLQKRFGVKAGLLLDLAAYLIVDEENAGQYYPDFAFAHPLFSEKMHIYSDSAVSRFLSSISQEQILGFLDDWNKRRDHTQRIYISYDATNKNCEAGDISLIEYGKAKDDKGVPIFNVAVAFDKTNRVPLLYEEYPGSVVDVSQFTFLVDKVIDYGYRKVGFILDRGYFSKENIRYMDENGYSFIMMVKGCRPLVSSLILENRNTFETDRSCAIRAYRAYGKTVAARLYEDDEKGRFFHIFFNPSRQAAERERLELQIEKYRQFLDKQIGTVNSFGKTYQKYFKLHYDKDNKLLSVEERSDVVQRELELCGYYCIITSEKMKPAEALTQYKGRDISEKLFRADKSFIGSRSMRVYSNEALTAKVFIEFVALIVRNRIYNLLKDTLMRIEISPNYMTVPAALRELEKIEMVRRTDGRYRLDHAVTKKQKTILSAFGLDENSIRNTAAEISSLLTANQSLLDASDKEDSDGENPIDSVD
jgi:transposase